MNPIAVFFILYFVWMVIAWIAMGTVYMSIKPGVGLVAKVFFDWSSIVVIPTFTIEWRNDLVSRHFALRFEWLPVQFVFGIEKEKTSETA